MTCGPRRRFFNLHKRSTASVLFKLFDTGRQVSIKHRSVPTYEQTRTTGGSRCCLLFDPKIANLRSRVRRARTRTGNERRQGKRVGRREIAPLHQPALVRRLWVGTASNHTNSPFLLPRSTRNQGNCFFFPHALCLITWLRLVSSVIFGTFFLNQNTFIHFVLWVSESNLNETIDHMTMLQQLVITSQ